MYPSGAKSPQKAFGQEELKLGRWLGKPSFCLFQVDQPDLLLPVWPPRDFLLLWEALAAHHLPVASRSACCDERNSCRKDFGVIRLRIRFPLYRTSQLAQRPLSVCQPGRPHVHVNARESPLPPSLWNGWPPPSANTVNKQWVTANGRHSMLQVT